MAVSKPGVVFLALVLTFLCGYSNGANIQEVSRIVFDDANMVTQYFGYDTFDEMNYDYALPVMTALLFHTDADIASGNLKVRGVKISRALIDNVTSHMYAMYTGQHPFDANVPYGPTAACRAFADARTGKNYAVVGAVNGHVFVDLGALEAAAVRASNPKKRFTYRQAVAEGIVVAFLRSTWNSWHEYAIRGNYLYAVQESIPVSAGMEIIDISNPRRPQQINLPSLVKVRAGWINPASPIFSSHYFEADPDRNYLYLNGAILTERLNEELPLRDIQMTSTANFNKCPESNPDANSQDTWVDEFPTRSAKRHDASKDTANHRGKQQLFIVDISNPRSIVIRGKWSRTYIHGVEAVKMKVDGRDGYYLFCPAIWNNVFYILNITDISKFTDGEFVAAKCLPNANVYWPHSTIVSSDRKYMYLTSEDPGNPLFIYNISNIRRPILERALYPGVSPQSPEMFHEARLEVVGSGANAYDRLWMASYSQGVQVLEIQQSGRPQVAATGDFTTRGTVDGCVASARNFCGSWAAWPVPGGRNLGITQSISPFGSEEHHAGSGTEEPALILVRYSQ